MNHPHIKYLRENGANTIADALESGADRKSIPYHKWETAFHILSKLPRGSTLLPIVRHALEITAK